VHYLLAIASAALYGAADFLGGVGSRRASTIAIVVTSQGVGMIALAAVLPLLPEASPTRADLLWGAAAGMAGSAGVALLYRALAVGTMAVAAPITAVCAVIIPVMTGVLRGERLGRQTFVGIALAMAAIVLVSQQHRAQPEPSAGTVPGAFPGPARSHSRMLDRVPPGVGLALASGVAIGLFYLALARTAGTAGLWPLLPARVVSVMLFAGIALASGRPLGLPAPVARIAIAAGLMDMLANALYLAATRLGPLSVVVTLSSLYPASIVILARIALRERLNGWQVAGVGCALVAIALIVGNG